MRVFLLYAIIFVIECHVKQHLISNIWTFVWTKHQNFYLKKNFPTQRKTKVEIHCKWTREKSIEDDKNFIVFLHALIWIKATRKPLCLGFACVVLFHVVCCYFVYIICTVFSAHSLARAQFSNNDTVSSTFPFNWY